MGLTNHAETMFATVGTGLISAAAVYVATKAVKAVNGLREDAQRIDRNLNAFRGREADPENGIESAPGVMVQLATLDTKTDALDRGQVEILRKQDVAHTEHEKLAGRVGRIETKVGQTLNAVTQ